MIHKTFTIEWSALFGALIALSLSFIVCLVMILGSYQHYNTIVKWEKEKIKEFGQIDGEYAETQEALENFKDISLYQRRLNQLKQLGFFSDTTVYLEEQREEIRKNLYDILKKHPMFSKEFKVLEKNRYSIPNMVIKEQLKVYEIPITFLNLGLLHEGELLKLIGEIERHNSQFVGLFNFQKCDMKRNDDNDIDEKDTSKAYIHANCVLNWYTFRIEKK
jgi:hypothetical protein